MTSKRAWVLGGVGVAVLLGVGLACARLVCFKPFRIPSAGMYPTDEPGSHIWVDRLARKPAYGAVMAFHYPENPQQDFLKRVVGLPGDEIRVHGTTLTINGFEVPHCDVGRASYVDHDSIVAKHTGTLAVEWLGDEPYLVFHDGDAFVQDFGPYRVKEGEYFVMGDNRENSHDSRQWFAGAGGGVPDANTVGRARVGKIRLPRGAESLESTLEACLEKKPERTRP